MAANYSTPVGQVRLLIADLDDANPVLTDDMINGYLDLNDGSTRLAAADALMAIATTEVLLAKKIRTQDLSTDGPAVAEALRKQAQQLREDEAAIVGSFFGVVQLNDAGRHEAEEWRL
ncbi:hypothetical protein [Zhihengliuella flava]|uniref:Uncharacterized protein n=1 Tax=Zhihengliuella flava TaxID=1285193 RepID=A0A931GFY0_9MICC|nr:hypothetical protein [Zhihengliuella flava]MBG6085818.1 hypothetical protein [Zhihengliuella flava]